MMRTQIREQLCFQLEPSMLQPYFSAGVAVSGAFPSSFTRRPILTEIHLCHAPVLAKTFAMETPHQGPTGGMGEHPALTSLRQFLLLAKLADADAVRLNLESGRLRSVHLRVLVLGMILWLRIAYDLTRAWGGSCL
jgi:hypothetical protein|eukprot:COSAG01_NODE_24264_length_784_cov_12.602920_1_plen_136_part_00